MSSLKYRVTATHGAGVTAKDNLGAASSPVVAIACIATAKGVTKVINETAMNADVTSTFTKSTVSVEGANGYAAKDYNVWVFEPAVAYGNAAVLKVTLG